MPQSNEGGRSGAEYEMGAGPLRKAEFRWASIAGADPEPVEVIEVEGRKGILTTGCADPFWLDEVGVVLYVSPLLNRPLNVLTQEEQDKEEAAYKLRMANRHGWRGSR